MFITDHHYNIILYFVKGKYISFNNGLTLYSTEHITTQFFTTTSLLAIQHVHHSIENDKKGLFEETDQHLKITNFIRAWK